MTWKTLSTTLGFTENCSLDVDASLHDFDRSHFWTAISNLKSARKPTTNEIHHPTLRFMHKWLAPTIFPKEELGTVRNEEMKLLYAIIKKKTKLSPATLMLHYWITIPTMKKCKIPFTSWVTCIANGLGLSDNVILTFISTPQRIIGFDFFAHAHTLIMIYKGYTNEYPLHDRNLGLYSVESFCLIFAERRIDIREEPFCTYHQEPAATVLWSRCYTGRADFYSICWF
jgi:hypothetical protein